METDLMKFFGLLLFISLSAGAAINKAPDLSRARSEMMEMGARLSSLEKEIGSKNNLYLSSIGQIKQFESDVDAYRARLADVRREVAEGREENKKILKSYMLEADNEATEPWQRRVHLNLLKKAQDKLKASENELISFENKVVEFEKKLTELRKNEEELAVVIKELESRKKVAMENYLAHVREKKVAEKKDTRKKIDERLKVVRKEFSQAPVVQAKADRIFSHPMEDYLSKTSSPKGVTFKYQSVQPVKAVGDGKIVFAGDLASYGQVVLIDHGNDLRTVLLGKMSIKVKKNDTVKSGDVLAYTINDSKEAQNLYFEVRKKNTAQNTILWLEPNGVSKI
ncbi:MAG: murein hydrolase activator EnvC family protein [Bacteriovoracaceae bacterium]